MLFRSIARLPIARGNIVKPLHQTFANADTDADTDSDEDTENDDSVDQEKEN
jgi:hypothetical protein